MTHILSVFARPRGFSVSARIAGLALLAGLSYGAATVAPAAAASNSWQNTCKFNSIPGGASSSMQYDRCMHMNDCQRMANAAGEQVFRFGCFGVQPDTQAPPQPRAPRR